MTRTLSTSGVLAAADTIRPLVTMTPVMRLPGSSALIKCESAQISGSFKIRGVIAALEATRAKSIVTGSSGNHGIALATAAAQRGVSATVVMGRSASRYKRALIEASEAKVVLCGPGNHERDAMARAIAAESGAVFISSHDDPAVITGQATVALDILRQVSGVTDIYVPVGGGGLLAGTCLATRDTGVRVVGVEPVGADCFARSLRAGRPVRLDRVDTVCDGARAPIPGELTFACSRETVSHIVTVDDDRVTAVRRRLADAGLVAENTGALALAGLLADQTAGPVPVAVVSGGNIAVPPLLQSAPL